LFRIKAAYRRVELEERDIKEGRNRRREGRAVRWECSEALEHAPRLQFS